MCLLGSLGYLDFLGTGFLDSLTKCMAETSTYYLKRDFKYGEGKIAKIHTFDCTKDFSFEKLVEETKNFTIPVICKGLLKDNKCRQWDLDYFERNSPPDDEFRLQLLEEVEGMCSMLHCTYSYIHTHTHTYTYIHIHTHTYTTYGAVYYYPY
ncbi:hypothetical protein EON63_14540 [archaeon]|nr:MAG: hypothetical protein EON63_14540 [archaeon]